MRSDKSLTNALIISIVFFLPFIIFLVSYTICVISRFVFFDNFVCGFMSVNVG